jgi:uncharacterized membrane protein YdbT with pleckstrin-like domain
MSSYVEKVLVPGEQIRYMASLHWIIYLQGLVITIFGGLLGFNSYAIVAHLFGSNNMDPYGHILSGIALFITVVGVALLLGAYVRQSATELVLTDRRIIAKYGVIARATFEIMASRITGANFDQTITGRLLGYGTILVHGAGGEISPIDLVADPQSFHRALLEVIEHTQGGPPAAGTPR